MQLFVLKNFIAALFTVGKRRMPSNIITRGWVNGGVHLLDFYKPFSSKSDQPGSALAYLLGVPRNSAHISRPASSSVEWNQWASAGWYAVYWPGMLLLCLSLSWFSPWHCLSSCWDRYFRDSKDCWTKGFTRQELAQRKRTKRFGDGGDATRSNSYTNAWARASGAPDHPLCLSRNSPESAGIDWMFLC